MEATLPIFYSNFLKETPLLTREQEIKLSQDVLNGTKKKSEKAINKLVESNIKLAIKIATNDFGWFKDREDIISEAVLGLRKAAEKYDSKFGARFSTYSSYYIRQHIFKYINRSSIIPMSREMLLRHQRIQNAMNTLSSELGREATLEEVADALGMDEEKVESILNYKLSYVNFNTSFKDDEAGNTLADVIEDTNAIIPDKFAETSSDIGEVDEYLKDLKPRELFVIKKRFGFDGEEPMILQDVGNILNVTRERTRQIQEIALHKIKKNLENRNKLLKKSIDDLGEKCENAFR